MRRNSWFMGGLVLAAGFATWGAAEAWWVKGHGTITEAAANALPECQRLAEDMPPATVIAGQRPMASDQRETNPALPLCRRLR